MLLARVTGRVVSTARLDALPVGRQYLEVTLEPGYGDPGQTLIAIDGVQAGPGDLVLVMQEGTGARQILLAEKDLKLSLPAQAVIAGIVDRVDFAQ